MAQFYPYLISSLPTLSFTAPPPFSFEKFLALCCELIPEKDVRVLKKASINPLDYRAQNAGCRSLEQWFAYDTLLRNELVKIRAARKHLDPQPSLRQTSSEDSAAMHVAMHAYRALSIPEGEKILDLERWRQLEEFGFGHYFDLDALMVYALKLLLVLRWQEVRKASNRQTLENILQEATK